jgi:hypothetical protein
MDTNYRRHDDDENDKFCRLWRFGCCVMTIILTVGCVLLFVASYVWRPDLENLPIDNCLVNNTSIQTLDYMKNNMFQLIVTYQSTIDGIEYLSHNDNKRSNDYNNLKIYSESRYPLYGGSTNCYYDKKNDKVKYDDRYQETQNRYDNCERTGVLLLIFAVIFWFYHIYILVVPCCDKKIVKN